MARAWAQLPKYEHGKQNTKIDPSFPHKPEGHQPEGHQPGQRQKAEDQWFARGNDIDQQLHKYQAGGVQDLQSHKAVGMEEGQGHPPHLDEKHKRVIYDNLRERMKKGEHLSDKQKQAYQLLSLFYGEDKADRNDREHIPVLESQHGHADRKGRNDDTMEEGGGQDTHPIAVKSPELHGVNQAHVPAGPLPAAIPNNDQEEVKDLLDGQQNLKGSQRGEGGDGKGMAGALDSDNDDVDLLHHGEEQPNVEAVDQAGREGRGKDAQPLQHHVPGDHDVENNNLPHPLVENAALDSDGAAPEPGAVRNNEDDEDADSKDRMEDEPNGEKQLGRHDAQFEVCTVS